ncbi:hypothetical protein GOP47_0003628 [Adiantum capillus-veneris]|uniref:Uncharacterized protein n=1 Tax=Adiantum capillus-veneris TaxID=13818 RepID=A0A9D4V5Z2_ADICA|nr:hypothetical protein GOP47_0003628 [Adiantum capillus-veneris]
MLTLLNNCSTYSFATPTCVPARFNAVSVALSSVGGLLMEDLLFDTSHQVNSDSTSLFPCQIAIIVVPASSAEEL